MKRSFPPLIAFFAVCGNAAANHTAASAFSADSIPAFPSSDSISALPSSPPHKRTVSPVQNSDNMSQKPVLHYYDKHGNPLKEPVAIWVDEDTVKIDRRPKAPLFNGICVGINFFDAILQVAGQSYACYDVSAAVDLHNWFFPTLEIGLGHADSQPKEKNFHYKTNPSLFARLGIDYNFLYNSNPDYKALFGVRCGFSSFGYYITDISIPDDYWSSSFTSPSIPRQKSTAFWGELCAGLNVKIWKGLCMGWAFRYKMKFHISDGNNSTPWFIPGFGARNAPFTATFTISYTFGKPSTP